MSLLKEYMLGVFLTASVLAHPVLQVIRTSGIMVFLLQMTHSNEINYPDIIELGFC